MKVPYITSYYRQGCDIIKISSFVAVRRRIVQCRRKSAVVELTICHIVDEITVDELTVDELTVDELTVDDLTNCRSVTAKLDATRPSSMQVHT
jgi:hypothetical protein